MQTILRFDCKLALVWFSGEDVGKFGIFDNGVKYETVETFEGHMWHHSGLVVTEDGQARLYVDGQLQEIRSQATQATSTEVLVNEYPNKCPTSTFASKAERRAGHASDNEYMMDAPVHGSTRSPVPNGYLTSYNATSKKYEVDSLQSFCKDCCTAPTGRRRELLETANTVAGLSSCTFRMATGCTQGGVDVQHSFDGFLDEVAVWNRPITEAEMSSTMFQMPQALSSSEMMAPRGVQVDYTAGRVLYARFNNPCMEAPARPDPVATAPPSPAGNAGRRELEEKFSDIVDATSYVSMEADVLNKYSKGVRRPMVTDYAVRTA